MSHPGARRRLTFQGNLRETRHGWLRLTPAYSVHLVRELLDEPGRAARPVLDPFCGTGTTALTCGERGFACDTVDLNPFLVWLARAKSARYTPATIDRARARVHAMAAAAERRTSPAPWLPPIYRIDRWWHPDTARALGHALHTLRHAEPRATRAGDLARLALCRAVIETSNVSFAHQSMSFRNRDPRDASRGHGPASVADALHRAIDSMARAAIAPAHSSQPRVLQGDSRDLTTVLGQHRYGTVVTSPPYPNRMSYIRELRPYMYWLGYLTDRRGAGELDWRVIGGTWGSATSRLADWQPDPLLAVPFSDLSRIARDIELRSEILSRYVLRYFQDMTAHIRSLCRVLARGARVHYVVGNSKFYDVIVPVQEIYAALFESVGLRRVHITELRKRTSKSELFEYLVTARRA